MNKFFAMVAVAGISAMGWAAQNDALLTFSTKGPDKYADGTTVLDGECYALVWTAKGNTFAGLDASGNPVSAADEVVLVAPVAKDGKCPVILFQIDVAKAEAMAGGSYGVYLLDTRVATANGVKPTGTKSGKPALVNGYGLASETAAFAGNQFASAVEQESEDGQAVSAAAAVPKNVKQPKIKAIRIEGDNVFLTVENLPGFMRAQGGSDLNANEVQGAAQATDGNAASDVILVMPKGDKQQGFFKVIRN